ncbi:zinc-binding dehydrogenase [Saccharothrix texasensis]|uniref:NADPH2:quinone reductase n=1 Tax=Saccharothrix texasensis TaxID=103734 RepID=A0A3N1H6U2_9PSEU|nr:zinc-binding dehydrogenase [Saccharothrix texasensis]ROP38136.1 NADPH2:quinone reductase [Saccharothrix texasensis]
MRAVRLHAFGSALRCEEVEDPSPGPGQVRIAVRAAGVHLLDGVVRRGGDGCVPLPDLPAVLGSEVAGVVDAVGRDVDESWLGQRVVTQLGLLGGGYAELAVREVGALHVVPAGLDFPAAVAMICTGSTALGVLDAAAPAPDDVVVVTAAAGGVGTLLVQGAARAGALVVGLAGCEEKRRAALRAGAAVAVDYLGREWQRQVRERLGGREVTAVLDGVGGVLGRAAVDLLAPGGRVVMFGSSSGEPAHLTSADLFARALTATVALGPQVAKRSGGLRALETRALAAAADHGLTPSIQPFPLADAGRAHEAMESRHTVGKVVLLPAAG